jgi:hypothetical protein
MRFYPDDKSVGLWACEEEGLQFILAFTSVFDGASYWLGLAPSFFALSARIHAEDTLHILARIGYVSQCESADISVMHTIYRLVRKYTQMESRPSRPEFCRKRYREVLQAKCVAISA